jgi:hypothetical protein
MVKRILLALALAASLGGAVVACNSPSGTTSPGGSTGTTTQSNSISSPEASMGAGDSGGTTTESASPSSS